MALVDQMAAMLPLIIRQNSWRMECEHGYVYAIDRIERTDGTIERYVQRIAGGDGPWKRRKIVTMHTPLWACIGHEFRALLAGSEPRFTTPVVLHIEQTR